VHDDRERVDGVGVDEDVELDEGRLSVAADVVVERGVAARQRLQPIVKSSTTSEGQLVVSARDRTP
jgi:hypothetical protein